MVLVQYVQIITVEIMLVYFMAQNKFEFFYIKQSKIVIS